MDCLEKFNTNDDEQSSDSNFSSNLLQKSFRLKCLEQYLTFFASFREILRLGNHVVQHRVIEKKDIRRGARAISPSFQKYRICGICKNMVHRLVINIPNMTSSAVPCIQIS